MLSLVFVVSLLIQNADLDANEGNLRTIANKISQILFDEYNGSISLHGSLTIVGIKRSCRAPMQNSFSLSAQ